MESKCNKYLVKFLTFISAKEQYFTSGCLFSLHLVHTNKDTNECAIYSAANGFMLLHNCGWRYAYRDVNNLGFKFF